MKCIALKSGNLRGEISRVHIGIDIIVYKINQGDGYCVDFINMEGESSLTDCGLPALQLLIRPSVNYTGDFGYCVYEENGKHTDCRSIWILSISCCRVYGSLDKSDLWTRRLFILKCVYFSEYTSDRRAILCRKFKFQKGYFRNKQLLLRSSFCRKSSCRKVEFRNENFPMNITMN